MKPRSSMPNAICSPGGPKERQVTEMGLQNLQYAKSKRKPTKEGQAGLIIGEDDLLQF